MSESFFSKTAKFTPNILKSSVGNLKSYPRENGKQTSDQSNTFTQAIKKVVKRNNDIFDMNISKNNSDIHIVKKGETLSHIALLSMKDTGQVLNTKLIMQNAFKLAKHNGIKNPDLIITGQKLDLSVIKKENHTLALNSIEKNVELLDQKKPFTSNYFVSEQKA